MASPSMTREEMSNQLYTMHSTTGNKTGDAHDLIQHTLDGKIILPGKLPQTTVHKLMTAPPMNIQKATVQRYAHDVMAEQDGRVRSQNAAARLGRKHKAKYPEAHSDKSDSTPGPNTSQ